MKILACNQFLPPVTGEVSIQALLQVSTQESHQQLLKITVKGKLINDMFILNMFLMGYKIFSIRKTVVELNISL